MIPLLDLVGSCPHGVLLGGVTWARLSYGHCRGAEVKAVDVLGFIGAVATVDVLHRRAC